MVSPLVDTVHIGRVRDGDPFLLWLPDTIPASVAMVSPLADTVCSISIRSDPTLLHLPDSTPAPVTTVPLLVITVCQCSMGWRSYSVLPT